MNLFVITCGIGFWVGVISLVGGVSTKVRIFGGAMIVLNVCLIAWYIRREDRRELRQEQFRSMHCVCGTHGHIDAEFAYYAKCKDCGRLYAMGCNVKMIELVTPEEQAIATADNSQCVKEFEQCQP